MQSCRRQSGGAYQPRQSLCHLSLSNRDSKDGLDPLVHRVLVEVQLFVGLQQILLLANLRLECDL